MPHVHQAVAKEVQHHHHSDQHHHHNTENNSEPDHDNTCDHYAHNEDFGKVVVKLPANQKLEVKPVISDYIFVAAFLNLFTVESPPPVYPPGNNSTLHLIFLSHSIPLRAPPSLLPA